MPEGIFTPKEAGFVGAGVAVALAGMMMGADQGSRGTTGTAQSSLSAGKATVKVLGPAKTSQVWLQDAGRKVHLTLVKRESSDVIYVYHTFTDRSGRRAPLSVKPACFWLAKDQITEQTFRIEGEGAAEESYSGRILLVAGREDGPTEVSVSIAASRPSPYADEILKLGAILGALSVVFGSVYALWKFGIKRCMRDLAWASNSWATNTAIAAGVLALLITFVAADDVRARLSQGNYKLLIAAFSVPALIAPVLFNAIRKNCEGKMMGISSGYVLASAATLLASQSQLALLLSMVEDLYRSAIVGPMLMKVMWWMVVCAMFVLGIYGNLHVYTSIRSEAELKPSTTPTLL